MTQNGESGEPKQEFEPLQILGVFWSIFGFIVLIATFFVTGKEPPPIVNILNPVEGEIVQFDSSLSVTAHVRSFQAIDSIRVARTLFAGNDPRYVKSTGNNVCEVHFTFDKPDTNLITIYAIDKIGAVGVNVIFMEDQKDGSVHYKIETSTKLMTAEVAEQYRTQYLDTYKSRGKLTNLVASILLLGVGLTCLVKGIRKKKKRLSQ